MTQTPPKLRMATEFTPSASESSRANIDTCKGTFTLTWTETHLVFDISSLYHENDHEH